MKHETGPRDPHIPTTPLRMFVRNQGAEQSLFHVMQEDQLRGEEIGEPTEDEIEALAQIIFQAYLEHKQCSNPKADDPTP